MIDMRYARGDTFKILGVLSCEKSQDFDRDAITVTALIRKADGGVKIADLDVSLGAYYSEDNREVVEFELTYQDGATLPTGPIALEGRVEYKGEVSSFRAVSIYVEDRL